MTLLSSLVLPQLHQPLVHWWNHPHHHLQCRLFQEATTLTLEQVLDMTPMMMMVDLSVLVMITTPEMMRIRRVSGTLGAIRKIYSTIWWTRSLTNKPTLQATANGISNKKVLHLPAKQEKFINKEISENICFILMREFYSMLTFINFCVLSKFLIKCLFKDYWIAWFQFEIISKFCYFFNF